MVWPPTPAFDPGLLSSVDSDSFKDSMRHLAGAVSVITVGKGDDRTDFTATSVSSLSVELPSILVGLNPNSSSWTTLQRHGHFAVNVLAHDQQHIAGRLPAGAASRASIVTMAANGQSW